MKKIYYIALTCLLIVGFLAVLYFKNTSPQHYENDSPKLSSPIVATTNKVDEKQSDISSHVLTSEAKQPALFVCRVCYV